MVGLTALATATGGFLGGMLAAAVGVTTLSPTTGIVLRGIVSMLLVAVSCGVLGARARGTGPRPVLAVAGGALLGFALDPFTWVGRAVFTQLAVDPGPQTVAGDLLLWMVAAGAGAAAGARSRPAASPPLTPYG